MLFNYNLVLICTVHGQLLYYDTLRHREVVIYPKRETKRFSDLILVLGLLDPRQLEPKHERHYNFIMFKLSAWKDWMRDCLWWRHIIHLVVKIIDVWSAQLRIIFNKFNLHFQITHPVKETNVQYFKKN